MKVIAKKSLGQNFLQDTSVIEGILDTARVEATDWIVEIGPGTGNLTAVLLERAEKVLAIELDHSLISRLEERFAHAKNFSLQEGDILDFRLEEWLEKSGIEQREYKIIANIPYYITAPIIRMLLSLKRQPMSLTLMVQAEVADRLAAAPGKMSLLSVMAQYYSDVEKKFFVPKEAFEPVPKVDSAVIHIVPRRPFSPEEDKAVFRLARAGFAARRKTLANNLASTFSLPKESVENKLEGLGLRKDIRAQALSTHDWERLAKSWI